MTLEDDDAPEDVPREPQAAWAPLSARDFAARFAAVEVLDEGRDGKTYRARDRSREGREVALAVLLARAGRPLAAIEGFFQDVRTAQSLVSPHLVEIVDVGGLEDGRLFVATELVQGESLAARLAREGELRPEVALEIARQTLAALAAAHAKSLAHGAIEARHVWLAARVPKTTRNPDGIHVRLAGFGLATLVADDGARTERSEPTISGDLAAVADLVERMVGAAAAASDARVRGLLGRLRARPADGRASPAAAAVAAAATETRAKPARPRWAIAGLSVLGIAAIAEGFLFLEQRSENQKLEAGRVQAELERTAALREQEQWCGARMEELQERIRARDQEISDLGRKLERELASAEQQSDAAKSREELERMRRELDASKGERERLAASLAETQGRAKELEREKQRILLESSPGARAARGFDRLLALVAEDRGRDALAHFEELARTDALGAESQRAAAWMRELATAAAALEDARADADPGAALERANRALAALSDLERGFAVEAGVWRGSGFDDGGDVDRAAAGEATRRALAAKVRDASGALQREHAADWARVQALPPRADPDDVLRHVARFECGHLADWTGAVAKELERELASGGALDVARLCESELLGAWERVSAELSGAPELADWLDARRWYCGDDDALPEGATLPAPSLARSEPHVDWRATLRLERALAAPASAYPLPSGWLAVWRDADLLRKTTAWYVDELADERGDRDEHDWEIRRAVYVGDGLTASSPQRLVLARRGDQLTRAGKLILDFKAHGAAVRVGSWRADPTLAPPPKSWFPSAQELATFRSELAQGSVPALILTDGAITRWFSPRLGLVREEAEGVFRMELVYLGPKR